MLRMNEQLLKQCEHRFRSLGAELIDARRSGLISEVDYIPRNQRLQKIEARFQQLKLRQEATSCMLPTGHAAIELPLLSECSRAEQQIIQSTLAESAKMLETIANDTTKLMQYVKSAHSNDSSWIRTVLRLSWIRARIHWAASQSELVRSMRQVLEVFIKKFSPRKDGAQGQGDLVEAFREFEGTSSRIAHLRSRLQSEIAMNIDQENWLKSYDARRKSKSTPEHPPVPAAFTQAKQEVEERLSSGSAKANERLVIATRLAKSLVTETRNKAEIAALMTPLEDGKTKMDKSTKRRGSKSPKGNL